MPLCALRSMSDEDIEIEIEEELEEAVPTSAIAQLPSTPKADDRPHSPLPRSPTPSLPAPPSSPLPPRPSSPSPAPAAPTSPSPAATHPLSTSPPPAHHATAPIVSHRPLSPSPAPVSSHSPSNSSSLPSLLPSSLPSGPSRSPPSPADATQTSALSLTSSSSSLTSRTGTDLGAVHLFSSGLHLPPTTSTSGSTSSSLPLPLTSTGPITPGQREAAALEDLVAALNKENARLLLDLKRREQQLDTLQSTHNRDLKRLRDDVRTEVTLSQARRFDDSEEGKAKEIEALKVDLHTERVQARDKEQTLQHEINRLTALAAPSHPSAPGPHSAPLPPPIAQSADERDEYIGHLQRELHERDQHIRALTAKLQWYADNQPLLTQYEARTHHLQTRIQQLEKALASHAGRGEGKSLPADVKRIKALEREVELLRRRGTGDDGGVAGLIEAARPGVEEAEAVRGLRVRVGELEKELQTRDERWEHRLRGIRQEQDKIRLGYERKVKALQDALQALPRGRRAVGGKAEVGKVEGREQAGGHGEEVVREMESRMEEMRQFYERRIDELTRGQAASSASVSTPAQRPTSPPPSSLYTPTRSHASARVRRQPQRSPARSVSPVKPAAHAGQGKAAGGREAVQHRPQSPPAAARAKTPPPRPVESAGHGGVGGSRGVSRAEVERELQYVQAALQAAHKEELTHLSSHYAALFASLQEQMEAQVTALQRRCEEADDKSGMMGEQVRELQLELWKREKELQEKGWEVDRYREKPGTREFVVLEREVRELQERMGRREKEYREETEMARLREEEERARLVDRYEGVLRRKKEQIRQFEAEMENLVDLLHRQQQHSSNGHASQSTEASRPVSPLHSPLTPREEERGSREVLGGPAVAPVLNYVVLLERMEAEGGAMLEEVIGGIGRVSGKENVRARTIGRTVGSSKKAPEGVRAVSSTKAAPIRRVPIGSMKKPPPGRNS